MITLSNENNIYIIIAKNIKKYRKQKMMTQQELARKTGYSYAYIRRIEGPKCSKNFSVLTLYNISQALNIDIRCLFDIDDI